MAKARPMPILESNHKVVKPGNDLIGYLPSHGQLKKVKEPKSLKRFKKKATWYIKCSIYLLRRMTNWEREGE